MAKGIVGSREGREVREETRRDAKNSNRQKQHNRYPRSGITSVTNPASNSTAAEPSAHLSV